MHHGVSHTDRKKKKIKLTVTCTSHASEQREEKGIGGESQRVKEVQNSRCRMTKIQLNVSTPFHIVHQTQTATGRAPAINKPLFPPEDTDIRHCRILQKYDMTVFVFILTYGCRLSYRLFMEAGSGCEEVKEEGVDTHSQTHTYLNCRTLTEKTIP